MAYYFFSPRPFRVKEPRHSESDFAKKRYTSIVARVLRLNQPIATTVGSQVPYEKKVMLRFFRRYRSIYTRYVLFLEPVSSCVHVV